MNKEVTRKKGTRKADILIFSPTLILSYFKQQQQPNTMNKIALIVQREYNTRIRKKSFWISTLLVPFLMAGIYAIPVYLSLNSSEHKVVEVIDEHNLLHGTLASDPSLTLTFKQIPFQAAKAAFHKNDADVLVEIPADLLEHPNIKIISKGNLGLGIQHTIQTLIQNEVRTIKLTQAGVSLAALEANQLKVEAQTFTIDTKGSERSSSSETAMILGFVFGFILYVSVMMYGSQVMNGVIEEKSNRIIEVLISSVKPFELMMGKIIGIGLLGLTQFLLWGVLTITAAGISKQLLPEKPANESVQKQLVSKASPELQTAAKVQDSPLASLSSHIGQLPLGKLFLCFLGYFLAGYLLYSSLFAAIGSAVESSSEAQQFMFPVTIPIIFSFILAQFIIQSPDSSVAFWASIFPLTAPIDMMVRLPFGVPNWQLALSFTLLILTFISSTWMAGKIYRVGILMYGKKSSWKELSKWLFYKQ